VFEKKLVAATESPWWDEVWRCCLQNAGLFITCLNAFDKSIHEIEEGVSNKKIIEGLSKALEEVEPWLPQLQEWMIRIDALPNPRGNTELGLFFWCKSGLLAQFAWVEVAYNAYVLWVKSFAGQLAREDAEKVFRSQAKSNYEYTQMLPRMLDDMQTTHEWPSGKSMNKTYWAHSFQRAQTASRYVASNFPS